MTRSEVAKLMTVLVAAYPNTRISADTCELYETRLADLDFGVAQLAVAGLIDVKTSFPTIADIRREAHKLAPKPALPSFNPDSLPSKREVEAFYAVRRFTPETFQEPPASAPRASDKEIQERHEKLKAQARELLEQDGEQKP